MSSQSTQAPLVGIFVGGRGTRLGGAAKGNLRYEGETLLARLVRTCEQALPGAPVVLVGAAAAYAELGLAVMADDPQGIGPLGGLRALLVRAHDTGHAAALALACDLPRLGPDLVRRVAFEAPAADFVAPRDGELWDTLVARYAVSALPAVDAAIAAGERALQRVPGRLGARAVELAVTDAEREELRDWDTPDDMK